LLAGLRRLPEGRRKQALSASVEAAIRPHRETRSVLPFSADAASHYADILATRERVGLPIAMAGAQIAAICLAHGATCATRNTADYAYTGVKLVNPWTA
jgi:predicted nucleic acid-binding protein